MPAQLSTTQCYLQVMAPFTPFLTEHMYQNLRRCQPGTPESVHFCDLPESTPEQPGDQAIQQARGFLIRPAAWSESLGCFPGWHLRLPVLLQRLCAAAAL